MLKTSNGLKVGDVVHWASNAEATMVTWGRHLVRLHPTMVIVDIPKIGDRGYEDAIVADVNTGKIVKRRKNKTYDCSGDASFEGKRLDPSWWGDCFFVKDAFLTAAYKAQKDGMGKPATRSR